MKHLFAFIFFFSTSLSSLLAQTPTGVWKTVDDKTGEEKSYVEIYEQDDRLYGKITQLLQAEPDALCDACKGKLKNQPILGMLVIEDLEAQDDKWKNGSILDPESGNTYKCTIWLENENELKVRGIHWTGLYRTQTWYRAR